MKRPSRFSGFTIIELVIVLIVIGILMGMVMKGVSLIRNARVKKDYVNFVERIVQDFQRYRLLMMEKWGHDAILGDGEVNGGVEPEANGFIDNNTQSIESLLGVAFHFTQVYLFPQGHYRDLAEFIESFPEVDPDFETAFRVTPDYFEFFPSGSEIKTRVRIYLGSDFEGDRTGNFIIFCDLPLDLAISFDTMIDGKADGERGRFIVLGYRLSAGTPPPHSEDLCHCEGGVCVGLGAEGGCPLPSLPVEQVNHLIAGYRL